jgi:hypothetical protein
MKRAWWLLSVLLAFAAGWISGRADAPKAGGETSSLSPRASSPSATVARETSRNRWAEKLREQEQPGTLMHEIPAKDRGPTIEAWVRSFGVGGLDGETVNRFWNVLDAWVAEDPDAAWQWASGISEPGMRELAMTGIAGSFAASDAQRAFDCLVAHGEFRHAISDSRLFGMMTRLSNEALEKGPLALIDLWEKLPKANDSVNSYSGLKVELDPATDVRLLLDSIRSRLGKTTDRPLYLSGVMETWATSQPEEARGYLIERIAAKENFADEWSEMRSVIAKAHGSAAADQWTLEMLRQLPEGDRGSFFAGNGWLNSPNRIFDLMQTGATEEESAQWITETLQATADGDGSAWKIGNLLGQLPIEKRIEYLKALRGTKAQQSIGEITGRWNLTASQVAEIRQAVATP